MQTVSREPSGLGSVSVSVYLCVYAGWGYRGVIGP